MIQRGYKSTFQPPSWVLPHYTMFPSWVSSTFDVPESSHKVHNSPSLLFPHQRFVKNFIGNPDSPYRGMLLYHGLGTGKTITSISIAESLSENKKIVILLPASLVSNYIKEVISRGNHMFDVGKNLWTFIDDNDPSFFDLRNQMSNLGVKNYLIKKQKGFWIYKSLDKRQQDFGPTETTEMNVVERNWQIYEDLNSEEKMQIQMQIENMVRSRYQFIHYNGISMNKIREFGRDMFDNKVVIIDEIHNFISSVKNESHIKKILYQLLMEAKNVKIIGLSGTPIINEPIEIAFLANLLHGYMTISRVSLVPDKAFFDNLEGIKTYFQSHRYIDYFEILDTKGEIIVRLVPFGFKRIGPTSSLVEKEIDTRSLRDNRLDILKKEMIKLFGVTIKKTAHENHKLLPDDDSFNDFFSFTTDIEQLEDIRQPLAPMRNKKVFMRRLQGIISYYESFDESRFPRVPAMMFVHIKMPDKVFEKYELVREKERQKEKRGRRQRLKPNQSDKILSLETYKAFSRALCLFCFPDEIPRIYPSDIRKAFIKELDVEGLVESGNSKSSNSHDEDKEKERKNESSSLYESKKAEMMMSLRKNKKKYLMGDGLKTYGPKYYELMLKLKDSPGSALIYSHFREIEGIGIMKEVLNAHEYFMLDAVFKKNEGWSLDLPSDKNKWTKPFYIVFSKDKTKNNILIDIFNSHFENLQQYPIIFHQVNELLKVKQAESGKRIENNIRGDLIKVVMITQSGAEGISLKNVRQVHILEPYWNPIRIKQVIGRAVRVDSHKQLPPQDRVVNTYMYIMTLGNHVLEEDFNRTSDEFLKGIADRKQRQIESVQSLLQMTAVDCSLNKKAHKHIESCFRMPKEFGTFAYKHTNVYSNVSNTVLEKKIVMKKIDHKIKALKDPKNGHLIYYLEDSGDVLNTNAFKDKKIIKVIGKIFENQNGKKTIKYIS